MGAGGVQVELTPRIKRRISKDYTEKDRETVPEILLEVLDPL
jgi:hypothetical protein